MINTPMMNENLMIGTAILSTFSNRSQKDSIDLLLPFVKYCLQETYNIGDVVSEEQISEYLQTQFAFTNLPIAIVNKALNRLAKANGCIEIKNKQRLFVKSVESDYEKIKDKKHQAMTLIESIIDKLLPYLNSNSFKHYKEDEAKHALFAFLEKYGLTTYTDALDNLNIPDFTNRLVARFVLDESRSNSLVFQNLIELMKGFFLSKAIYLDNTNNNLFNASMKGIVLILDAPLMLRILGLKTTGENKIAQEFLQSLPSSVKLRYLYQNLDELKNIIQGYKQQKILKGTCTHTLEYFDENGYSIEAIEEYFSLLDKKLLSLNIQEYAEDIPFSEKYVIDDAGLSARLKEKISSYKYNERALENDVESISAIYRLRKGVKYSSIENCKAIFVTNNIQLAYYTNQFLGDTSNVGCVMTETDFTILMWLKNKSRSIETPKEILLANAYSAIDEVTDVFMNGVITKIHQYEKEGGFDSSSMGVILENIFYRRELVERCNGDPNNLSADDFVSMKAKYDEDVIARANIDMASLSEALEREKMENDHVTAEHQRLVFNVQNRAKKNAQKRSSVVFWLLACFIYTVIIAITISGIVYTIIAGLVGEINALAIVGIALGVFGTIDLIVGKCKFILKMLRIIRQRVYDRCYYKEIAVLDNKTFD